MTDSPEKNLKKEFCFLYQVADKVGLPPVFITGCGQTVDYAAYEMNVSMMQGRCPYCRKECFPYTLSAESYAFSGSDSDEAQQQLK